MPSSHGPCPVECPHNRSEVILDLPFLTDCTGRVEGLCHVLQSPWANIEFDGGMFGSDLEDIAVKVKMVEERAYHCKRG